MLKWPQLLITAVVIIILMFFADGLFHAMLMRPFYDRHTAGIYYPVEQQKMMYLFLSEIPLFFGLTWFVSRVMRANDLLLGAATGAFFTCCFGATFVLVNLGLVPGWGKTLSVVEASWITFQGAVGGLIVMWATSFFGKRGGTV